MQAVQSLRESIRATTLSHMLDRVNETAALSDPFPHVIVYDFLPSEIYRQALCLLPPDEAYTPCCVDRFSDGKGISNRDTVPLSDVSLAKLDDERREFWAGLRDALAATELRRAMFHCLREGLSYRFACSPERAADITGFPRTELFREMEGYQIAPHPDTRKKIVTMQIALPEDDSQNHLGTTFYRLSMKPAHLLRAPRGFEAVKQCPFVPNVAYAFSVLNTLRKRSWHGCEPLPTGCGVRNSLLHIYYDQP